MKRMLPLLCVAALSLGACAGTLKTNDVNLHTSLGGANVNPSTGLSLGYGQTSMHSSPVVAPDGKTPITVADTCGRTQSLATFGTLNGTATATSTSGPTNQGPQAAVAVSEIYSTGEAARLLALGGGKDAPTADQITASNDCSKAATAAQSGAVFPPK